MGQKMSARSTSASLFAITAQESRRLRFTEVDESLYIAFLPTGSVLAATEAFLGKNPTEFAGAEILCIEGSPAFEYIKKFAETEIGVYRDINARLNSAFARPSLDRIYFGAFSRPPFWPLSDFVNVSLLMKGVTVPENVSIPYFATYNGPRFTSSVDYYSSNCLAGVSGSLAPGIIEKRSGASPLKTQTRIKRHRLGHMLSQRQDKTYRHDSNNLSRASARLVVDGAVKAYILGYGITGVLAVPNFSGSNGDVILFSTGLSTGASRLIIDVSNNGGGYVFLACSLLEALFPMLADIQYADQLRGNQLAVEMVQRSTALNAIYNPSQYYWGYDYTFLNNTPFSSSEGFFFALGPTEQNGQVVNFSSKFKPKDKPNGDVMLLPPRPDFFQPSNVLILSNGACFSSCAIFTYAAVERVGVQTVAVGGIPNNPMAYAAGASGWGYTLDELLQYDIGFLGLNNNTEAPQPLEVNAVLGYTSAQSFCLESDAELSAI